MQEKEPPGAVPSVFYRGGGETVNAPPMPGCIGGAFKPYRTKPYRTNRLSASPLFTRMFKRSVTAPNSPCGL